MRKKTLSPRGWRGGLIRADVNLRRKRKKRAAVLNDGNEVDVGAGDDDVFCPQENEYLQECLEVVQQEFMIFNRER